MELVERAFQLGLITPTVIVTQLCNKYSSSKYQHFVPVKSPIGSLSVR